MNPDDIDNSEAVDEVEFDFTDTKKGKFELAPEGEYDGVVTGFETGVSSGGHPQITLTWVLGNKYKQKHWLVLSEGAKWRAAEVFEALGFGGAGQKIKVSKDKIIGRQAKVKLVKDVYQGKEQRKIDIVKPHPDGPGTGGREGMPF